MKKMSLTLLSSVFAFNLMIAGLASAKTSAGYVSTLQTFFCGSPVGGSTDKVCNFIVTGTWNNPDTCSKASAGWYNIIDSTTENFEETKVLYSTLLAAKMANKRVILSNSGCTQGGTTGVPQYRAVTVVD